MYWSYPILPFGIVACTFFSDNLSRNSCIYIYIYRLWKLSFERTVHPVCHSKSFFLAAKNVHATRKYIRLTWGISPFYRLLRAVLSLGWFTPATNVEFRLNFVHFREWKTRMDPKKNSLHNRKHTNKNWTRNTECLFQSQLAFLTLQKLALKCFLVCILKCRPRICFNFSTTLYFRLWSGVKLA